MGCAESEVKTSQSQPPKLNKATTVASTTVDANKAKSSKHIECSNNAP